ncbi:hypothetical protein Q7P35_001604 [Cladosporium inversicolor]
MIAGACAWSRDSQRNAMDDSTAIQGRKHPWIAPAHATSLRLLILAVDANARTVDKCHGGRDSDYAVARVHRAHELCRQQAQASGGGYAPGRRRRAVKSERSRCDKRVGSSAARYRNLDQQEILAFFGAMKRGNSRYCQDFENRSASVVRKKNRLRSHASKEQQDVVAIKTHQADEKVTR